MFNVGGGSIRKYGEVWIIILFYVLNVGFVGSCYYYVDRYVL